jgi:hypothetical protein
MQHGLVGVGLQDLHLQVAERPGDLLLLGALLPEVEVEELDGQADVLPRQDLVLAGCRRGAQRWRIDPGSIRRGWDGKPEEGSPDSRQGGVCPVSIPD